MGGGQSSCAQGARVTGARRTSPRFLPLALGATLGIACCPLGLVALRRKQPTTPSDLESAVSSSAVAAIPHAPPQRAPHQDAAVGALRAALPANAWVVLDVDLSLLGAAGWAAPSALRPLNCEEVPPPSRLALALMPSGAKNAPPTDTPGWPGARAVPPASAEPADDAPDLVVAALGASEPSAPAPSASYSPTAAPRRRGPAATRSSRARATRAS